MNHNSLFKNAGLNCLALFLLHLIALPISYALNMDFAKSLSSYYSGKAEDAYPLLETILKDKHAPVNKKIDAAFILAYAPQSQLKQGKRQDYALFVLENKKQIENKLKANLIRIVSDGYFNDREFDRAENFYHQLLQDSDLRNQAYAEYRLGWIDLNLQKAPRTLQRWAKFIEDHGTELNQQDHDLFKSILVDSGRAWAEAFESGSRDVNYDVLIPVFVKFKSESPDFEEGIALGLKRYNRPELIEDFRKELAKTVYYGNVLDLLLKKKTVFEVFPCELPKWIDQSRFDQATSKDEFLTYTNQCAKRVAEKKLCDEVEGRSALDFFEKFDLNDKQLLPRISLSVSCKKWKSACRDLLELVNQTAETKAVRTDDQTTQAMYDSCVNVLDSKSTPASTNDSVILPMIRSKQAKLFRVFSEKNLFQKSAKDIVYGLAALMVARDQELKSLLIQDVLKSSEIYRNTLIPEILLENLTPQEQLQNGHQFLATFAKTPYTSTQLSVLERLIQDKVKSKDFAAAEALLQQFIPMTDAIAHHETLSGYWEYLWLALDETEQVKKKNDVIAWFKLLKIQDMKPARKTRTLGIAVQYDLIDLIWSHWPQFSVAIQSNSEVLKVFYQKTLSWINKGTLPLEYLNTSAQGRVLVRLGQNDPTLTSQEVKRTLGVGNPSRQDLVSLDQLRGLSSKLHKATLKLNGFLPQYLKAKLNYLKKEEGLLASTAWSDEKYLEAAKAIFSQDANWVISQLQSVQKQASETPQMEDLAVQLNEIIKSVEEQISRNTSPKTPEQEKTS